jgi:hypothetical protein
MCLTGLDQAESNKKRGEKLVEFENTAFFPGK